ncbi:UNVERIFIED_ORG: indolepyruvate ferredoxin oxidoreductase [Xanthomonas axonopodis]
MTSTAALSSPDSANTPELGRVDADYTLDHKYTRTDGRIYLSGVQALVRLPLLQRLRDDAAGLATAGFISGYRGSPLGGLDLELWRARKHLDAAKVTFTPGLNEDLAATMVWGTQQTNLFPGANVQGVYGMWYGKGPGVDRSGDVFKHGNAAGTSPFGGVLALAADDHACRSSTLPHGSEDEFVSAMMPILNPAGVQDILDMGLLGWAMSRYTGRWIGFKTIAETVESSASVDVDPFARTIVLPEDFALPPGGLSIRWPDPPVDQEMRLHRYAIAAAQAFARANRIDKVVLDAPHARLGIVTTGKSYLDVLQALEYLGLDAQACAQIGIRVYKVGMTWPLEPVGISAFAQGLEDIVVVEEKEAFIERQMKELFYNWPASAGARPSIVGKYDEQGAWILPSTGELTPATIAAVIGRRILRLLPSSTINTDSIQQRLRWMDAKEAEMALPRAQFPRVPHYCSGCPHNTSTAVPEGSRALGGIGCHYMVTWMNRATDTFTHMGGEGVTWSGQAPFTDTPHVFQNLGDGTYFHSGSLAIRQSVATGVNITYKILYNDAVAMTGGQPVDGTLSVPDIAHQLRAEGIHEIAVVSDDIGKWTRRRDLFPPEVAFHDRGELDAVQQHLRTVKGVSILIFDQTCATEKRRRRKRGKLIDPPKRVMINSLVCEGCGDCGEKSFCVSVLPKETEFGRKRQIDQSNCNKDYSCVSGFCPSFVTVHGGAPRKGKRRDASTLLDTLPSPPKRTALERPWNILITGVGGTGVVTIGALLGMAGHLEGKGATVLDQTGLAQKGGAVTTHIRIARQPADIHAVRIAAGEADLVLGCDMVVVNDYWALSKVRDGRTQVVLNTYEAMPGTFTTQPGPAVSRCRDHRRCAHCARWPGAVVAGCHAAGHRPAGRRHRQQSVRARLRLAARVGAAVACGADARDRTQWCRRDDESAGVRLGAPGGDRSAGGATRCGSGRCRRACTSAWRDTACTRTRPLGRARSQRPKRTACVGADRRQHAAWRGRCTGRPARRRAVGALAGRGHRASRRVPDRLPGCRLRAPLSQPGRARTHARAATRARQQRTDRGGGPLRLQADGLQGRIRGGAAVYAWRFPAPVAATVRGRLHAALPSGAAAAGQERRARQPDQARVRAVDVHRLQAAGAVEVPAWRQVRRLRLQRRTAWRAPADCRLQCHRGHAAGTAGCR